ncbi:hypothetical protein GCM10007978_16770 [Shewanella hanedai]|uniref:Lipoprotein n=1 Tax=Shewanella hanedai TaxID=25 RepID=A0A553JSH5_SHEHA|nr:hypothetical protein [Shewanella hanedai]TRY15416.1 hypothetical protein FN961_04970 [Shewanella hanedai]GGI79589.1 hypothetical protein GCM10007978_16770 [Shewanella hanedai]
MLNIKGFIAIGFIVMMGSACSNLPSDVATELVARGLCHSQSGHQTEYEKSECRKLVSKETKEKTKEK